MPSQDYSRRGRSDGVRGRRLSNRQPTVTSEAIRRSLRLELAIAKERLKLERQHCKFLKDISCSIKKIAETLECCLEVVKERYATASAANSRE